MITTIEDGKFYLLYVLIEMSDNVSDCHTPFKSLASAKEHMDSEIKSCKALFGSTEVLCDYEYYHEERTEDGYGFSIGIDEMTPM